MLSESTRIMAVGLAVLALVSHTVVAVEGDLAAPVLGAVTNAEQKVQRLSTKLEALRVTGRNTTYPEAALAVAELFCRFSRYDAGQASLREALNLLGVSIGLVTEHQLAQGGLPKETRVLIVPNARFVRDETVAAIQTARAAGVRVGIIGEESLAATPTGGSRKDAPLPGVERVRVGTPQEYQERFGRWLEEARVERDLLAVDAAGRPAWGLELRTARGGATGAPTPRSPTR